MHNNRYLYWITFVAVNGGLMFGLNMGGIAGATHMIREGFNLTDGGLGTVAALLTVGCLAGALFTGRFADRYGRKKVMLATAVLYIVSALGCALAPGVALLNLFRLTSGLAVGATSVVAPMYISEISPAARRGRLVSFNQFAITIGILLAYVFDFLLADLGPGSWRYMLAVPAAFGVLYLVFLCTSLPESPRWLLARGRRDEALQVMRRIGGEAFAAADTAEIERSLRDERKCEKVRLGELFRGRTGYVVLIGTLLAALQQITGINAVIMFAPDIFEAAGVGGDTALANAMLVGLVNFLMTIVALWLVDMAGRKSLLLWGAAGMVASLGFLTWQFALPVQNHLAVLVALLVYIAFFAASFSPVMWVVISEIYPTRIKALAMSFSTAVSWGCTFLTVQFTPVISMAGMQWLFGAFGLLSLAAFVFVRVWIPETKGKTLEQIGTGLGL